MDIVAVRAGLAANAGTLAGLTVTAYAPDAVSVPHFFPVTVEIDFDEAANDALDRTVWTCRLLVSRADDRSGQAALDAYLSRGAAGLKQALESDPTLAGAADFAVVTRIDGYGQYAVADTIFYGASVHVEVEG